MKALVKTEPGVTELHVMDIPTPACPDDGVLLKVRSVGVCGTDLHLYKWQFQTPLPLIMGHEFCGDIVEVGKNVKDWKVGDFVVSRVYGDCGKCQPCLEGHPEMCEHKLAPGTGARGAYAEYIESYPKYLLRVPEGVSEEEACCCEPAAVVVHGLHRARVEKDDVVVIAGVGIIGLLAVQLAKIYGAKTVIAVGVNSDLGSRLPLAQKYGADYIVNAQTGDTAEQVLAITNGRKPDLVVDCSGNVSSVESLFKIVKRVGRYAAIGVTPTGAGVTVDWFKMVCDCIQVTSSYASTPEDWQEVLDLLASGKLAFKDAITQEITMEQWRDVFEKIGDPSMVKAVIKPNKA